MSLLFETIKIADGIPCHLSWHNERLNRSRREFWPVKDDLDLTSIISVPQEYQQGIVRCNVYYEKGIEQITFNRYSRKEIKNLRLVESPGIDYHVKYTDRSALDLLLDQKEGCDEILIEVGGLITDTTISNIAFFDGKDWITPEKPLLEGVTRARLISEGKIKPGEIRSNRIHDYQGCVLINVFREPGFEPMIPVDSIIQ